VKEPAEGRKRLTLPRRPTEVHRTTQSADGRLAHGRAGRDSSGSAQGTFGSDGYYRVGPAGQIQARCAWAPPPFDGLISLEGTFVAGDADKIGYVDSSR